MSRYDGSKGPPDIEGMTSLKVDNLTYRTTMDDLERHFKKYGDVGDIYIPRDRDTHESRGFAFVRFYEERDADDAMDAMDGKSIDGREIRVALAQYGRPKNQYDPHRRGGGGGRGGRGGGYGGYGGGGRDRSGGSRRDDRGYRDRRSPPRRRRSRSRSRSPRRRSRSPSPKRSRSRSPQNNRRSASRSPARRADSPANKRSISRSRSPSRNRSRSVSRSRSR